MTNCLVTVRIPEPNISKQRTDGYVVTVLRRLCSNRFEKNFALVAAEQATERGATSFAYTSGENKLKHASTFFHMTNSILNTTENDELQQKRESFFIRYCWDEHDMSTASKNNALSTGIQELPIKPESRIRDRQE
jgi:hypothetical protein